MIIDQEKVDELGNDTFLKDINVGKVLVRKRGK